MASLVQAIQVNIPNVHINPYIMDTYQGEPVLWQDLREILMTVAEIRDSLYSLGSSRLLLDLRARNKYIAFPLGKLKIFCGPNLQE